jgi:predicted RNA-binding Zn-ribbon protein involved in translation (DUF1610 family)
MNPSTEDQPMVCALCEKPELSGKTLCDLCYERIPKLDWWDRQLGTTIVCPGCKYIGFGQRQKRMSFFSWILYVVNLFSEARKIQSQYEAMAPIKPSSEYDRIDRAADVVFTCPKCGREKVLIIRYIEKSDRDTC